MQSPLEHLITLFSKLPGLGPRSARRIVLQLIRKKEVLLYPLVREMQAVAETIQTCRTCGNLDAVNPCSICADPRRDETLLCVVEDLADLWAIERSSLYRGKYHVLGGVLSAIDGIDPEHLRIPLLLEKAGHPNLQEVIIATNATVEGQTTAHYITERLKDTQVKISRLAQGIPVGGELDYLDEGTLGAALRARLLI